MFVLNGKVLQPGKPFSHKGLQYPGDWLGKATPSQLSQVGIVKRTKTRSQMKFDSRFYFSFDNPRELTEVQDTLVSAQKQQLQALLSSTDWYYTRQLETGEVIPADVSDHRAECRRVQKANEELILSAPAVETLELYVNEGLEAYPQAL